MDYVQYGRVTSKLHAVKEADLKDGKDVAQYGTKVASYGLYGQDGTEDNYFYRGVNNTPYSATLASDLKNRAQELGGAIASTDTSDNWGASFGAKVQNPVYAAPAPAPAPTPAWGESTDQNNRK